MKNKENQTSSNAGKNTTGTVTPIEGLTPNATASVSVAGDNSEHIAKVKEAVLKHCAPEVEKDKDSNKKQILQEAKAVKKAQAIFNADDNSEGVKSQEKALVQKGIDALQEYYYTTYARKAVCTSGTSWAKTTHDQMLRLLASEPNNAVKDDDVQIVGITYGDGNVINHCGGS
jgi:hypothetical protein